MVDKLKQFKRRGVLTAYDRRRMENDAMNPDNSERCFTDEDMQAVFGDEL